MSLSFDKGDHVIFIYCIQVNMIGYVRLFI
jgi:hypothetical protein